MVLSGMFAFYLILAIGFVPDWFPDENQFFAVNGGDGLTMDAGGKNHTNPTAVSFSNSTIPNSPDNVCKSFPDAVLMDVVGKTTGLVAFGMKSEWSLSCIKVTNNWTG
jgi:hypothetical protein